MQVSFENVDSVNVTAHVNIHSSDVDPVYNRVVKKYVTNGTVPGFRKGKAPENLIVNKYADSIFEEVLRELYRSATTFIASKSEASRRVTEFYLKPVEKIVRGTDVNMDLTFQIQPQLELKPLADIDCELVSIKLDDEALDNIIKILQEQHSVLRNVDDAVAGDEHLADIDFAGTCDGVAFEGGTAKNYRLDLSRPDSMIPGFVDQIKGHKAGEEFDINVTFPENYGHGLDGKDAVFKIKIHTLSVKDLPSLEDLCKTLNVENGVEGLRSDLMKNLSREAAMVERGLNMNALRVAFVKANGDFDLPEALYLDAKEEIVNLRMQTLFGSQVNNMKRDIVTQLARSIAEHIPEETYKTRAKQTFILKEYAALLNIPACFTEDEIKERTEQVIKNIAVAYEDSETYREEIAKDKDAMQSLRNTAVNELSIDKFISSVKAIKTELSFDQARDRYAAERLV